VLDGGGEVFFFFMTGQGERKDPNIIIGGSKVSRLTIRVCAQAGFSGKGKIKDGWKFSTGLRRTDKMQ
jgi:hypothetical protein